MPVTYQVNALSPQWSLEDEWGKVTGTTVWQVIASEPITLADAVNAVDATDPAKKIPNKGQNMPGTTGCPCVKRSPKFADQTRMLVIVACEYDSTRTVVENPLSMPVKVKSSSESLEETFWHDESTPPKRPIHTNNVVFDELPRRQRSITVYEVERNVPASTSDASVSPLLDKVNDAPMTIDGRACAAETVLVGAVSLSEQKTLNGIDYKTLTCTLRYNAADWTQRIESRGLVLKGSTPKKPRPIVDDDGDPITDPWPLDADGQPLSPDQPGFEIALKPYKRASLAALV